MFNGKLIKALKNTINNLETELQEEKDKNEYYQKDMTILLETNAKLRGKLDKEKDKIQDLENNIELLVNNLSEQNKELVSDYQSIN